MTQANYRHYLNLYWQLIDVPVVACEQLLIFTVDTNVVTGLWCVCGSIPSDCNVSTACIVSIEAMAAPVLLAKVTGSPRFVPSCLAEKMFVFWTPCTST